MHIQSWAVGFMQASGGHVPRERALTRFEAAGFPQPIVFRKSADSLPCSHDAPCSASGLAAWPNFWIGLTELVYRQPTVDAYLVIQDGVTLCRDVGEYIAQLQLPSDCGGLSLLCPHRHNGPLGWNPLPYNDVALAEAVVLPREAALDFLSHPVTANHRWAVLASEQDRGGGLRQIDRALAGWCRLINRRFYCHSPSLAQTADSADVNTGAIPRGQPQDLPRHADSFPGEHVSAAKVFPKFFHELQTWIDHGGSPVWSIPGHLWAAISGHLRPGLRTLETGSGLSTKLFLDAGCQHTCLEHDPDWAQKLLQCWPECQPAMCCVRLSGDPAWYDWTPPDGPYDLLLVDGPPRTIGRRGFLRVLEQLVHDTTVLFLDDANGPAGEEFVAAVQRRLGWKVHRSTAGHHGYAYLAKSFPS